MEISETKIKLLERNIIDIAESLNISINDIMRVLKEMNKQEQEDKLMEEINSHNNLLGRCFVKRSENKYKYYKVISVKSSNLYEVECLVFDEHPTYKFELQTHKITQPGDFILGKFNFKSFYTDSLLAWQFDTSLFTEITLEEYNNAMLDYVNELINVDWNTEKRAEW